MSHPCLPFIGRLKIIDKNLNVFPLAGNMTWPQLDLLHHVEEDLKARRPIRYIVLKARQIGISTIIEALGFQFAFSFPHLSGLVVSHENDSAEHILGMMKFYWESWWARSLYSQKSNARDRLEWNETNSDFQIITARNVKGARSRTLQYLHCSEVAFWDNPEKLVGGMNQAIPRENPFTAIFLESTAQGIGNYFHRTWEAAKTGDVEYKPLFYAWWRHPYYTAERIGLADKAARLLLARPSASSPLGTLDDEEWILYQVFSRRLQMDDAEIKSRLVWRREMIRTECHGSLDTFHEEYPATDDEAFLSTGRNVFPLVHLRSATDLWTPDVGRLIYDSKAPNRVRFIRDPQGPLAIYIYPEDWNPLQWYVVGGDASKTLTGDFAVGQVLDRRTLEQCATFRQKITPREFAHQMILLGHYYNTALLVPENNMSGGGVSMIIEDQYPRVFYHKKTNRVRGQIDNMVGWITNPQTKAEAIQHLQYQLLFAYNGESTFRIHDEATYHECKNYVVNENGKFMNGEGSDHDDTVMALAIAIAAATLEVANENFDRLTDPAHQKAMRSATNPEQQAVRDGIMAVSDATGSPVSFSSEVRRDESGDMKMRLPFDTAWAERPVDMFSDGEDW